MVVVFWASCLAQQWYGDSMLWLSPSQLIHFTSQSWLCGDDPVKSIWYSSTHSRL